MLISKISPLPTYSLTNNQQPEHKLTGWTLKWQQKQLIVKARQQTHQASIEFANEQWLQECLQKSSVKIVKIDPTVGATNLTIWATACQQSEKVIFLRDRTIQKLPYLNSFSWRIKRFCDLFGAIALLVIFSPIMLVLIGWQRLKSPQVPLFDRQWHVGKRGQLFQLLKFNFVRAKYLQYLQHLPQLLNVLRGEMSLVGARPLSLIEATNLSPNQLNILPGISGLPAAKALLAKNSNSTTPLSYFSSWSLGKDFKILLQTLPSIFSGSIH